MRVKKCPFCDQRVLAEQKVYETETEYVIVNIRPGKSEGRCCVVSKRHVANLRELSEAETASFFKTVRLVSIKLKKHLKPKGFNYGLNEGKIAGQTLEHLHFHIIPRYQGDGLLEFHLFHRDPKTKRNLTTAELAPMIKKLRKIFSF